MRLGLFLTMIFLILINVVSSAWNFHSYLIDAEPTNMICGFVSAAVAILLIIQFGKEL